MMAYSVHNFKLKGNRLHPGVMLYNAQLGKDQFESRYRWNPDLRGGRYIDKNGQIVARQTVLNQLERVIAGAQAEMLEAGQDLIDGKIGVQGWYNVMWRRVKAIHHMSASVSVGGWAQLGPEDIEILDEIVARHVGYLNNFSTQVNDGDVKLGKRFMLRVKAYGDSGRSTAQEFARAVSARTKEATHEMRVLGPADHCEASNGRPGCVDLAGRWELVGTLPGIGEATCRHNCKCHFIFGRMVGGEIVQI